MAFAHVEAVAAFIVQMQFGMRAGYAERGVESPPDTVSD